MYYGESFATNAALVDRRKGRKLDRRNKPKTRSCHNPYSVPNRETQPHRTRAPAEAARVRYSSRLGHRRARTATTANRNMSSGKVLELDLRGLSRRWAAPLQSGARRR